MPAADLERLVELVLADPALQAELEPELDPERFSLAVVRLAGVLGLDVTREDVEEGLRSARRSWLERWL